MTESEMQRMQQEAVRRTQEMQRRAAEYSTVRREQEIPRVQASQAQKEREEPLQKEREEGNPEEAVKETDRKGGIFETLFKDKEKTLILGILLLLMDEKTDNGLMLSLMYLLI